ncbi:MAG: helix-turn-helix domain-containing protein [Isosphaeraceae bacterium]
MDPFFFRVEHGLLRSEAFKDLGGSAIKVYLTIGLYADFGTGWAYPSIRTIAKQAGLSRQTVLDAIGELVNAGLLAASKSKGRSTAYRIIREAPPTREKGAGKKPVSQKTAGTVPDFLGDPRQTVPDSLGVPSPGVPDSWGVEAQFVGPRGPRGGPERDPIPTREDTASIPIPGTPFRLSAEGRLLVAVDLQELLTDQGVPRRLAEKLAGQKDPEAVARVLLNAIYLKSQGRLQNAPGYIRAGIEEGYALLPEVESRLKLRQRELEEQVRRTRERTTRIRQEAARAAEEAAIEVFLNNLDRDELQKLIDQAIATLPPPMVRNNPTLTNPFVRGRVYEMAIGSESE